MSSTFYGTPPVRNGVYTAQGQTMKLVVDSVETENRVRALMQETLLGPKEIDAAIDFDKSVPLNDRPDIAKELAYFRSFNGK